MLVFDSSFAGFIVKGIYFMKHLCNIWLVDMANQKS